MTLRENIMAILHYQPYKTMPVVSFGYWEETLERWRDEGHVTSDEVEGYRAQGDNSEADRSVMRKLGFDFNWNSVYQPKVDLFPAFEERVLEEEPDGSRIVRDPLGLLVKKKADIVSIPAEIGTSLTGRQAWEELYLPKLQWTEERISNVKEQPLVFSTNREIPLGLHCGSLVGTLRNLLGVEAFSYLYYDDEDLFREIADQLAELSFRSVEAVLKSGATFDYAHYWEDICFKNGPLLSPEVFESCMGKHYQRTTKLLADYGIDIVSVDCDGLIDKLVPIWLEAGVNTMFPIEVGTWHASIAPWREQYGQQLRGVGGMNKTVFSQDYKAIDKEIERLRPLLDLGGYIPCPDHRIAPDARFENVQYYCEQMRKAFAG